MINWIHIKNLALVKEVNIDFSNDFNVISGETGAGKSVIMGAIGLLLGDRADKNSIRSGEKRCEISSQIKIPDYLINEISISLENKGIEFDSEEGLITIKRVITTSNSKNFINDTSVTLNSLKDLGSQLIDIHGANEHQSLIKQKKQLDILDNYAKTANGLMELKNINNELKDLLKEREELEKNIPNPAEAEHLKFVISDIKKINPEENEDFDLGEKHKVVSNSKDLILDATNSKEIIDGNEGSICDQMRELHSMIANIANLDEKGGKVLLEQSDTIFEQLQELSYDIEKYSDNLDVDEEALFNLEERLSEIQGLKRRYGSNLENVFIVLEDAELRYSQFQNSCDMRNEFDNKEKNILNKLNKQAEKISKKRKKASAKFAKEVTDELKKLGFLKSEFKIDFQETEINTTGMDKIDFLFSANPGVPPAPLRNIASSGEMSRIMLALKTVLADSDTIPVLIFDEIDVNIGGETAGVVGAELKKLANNHQVLSISHLPQVAANADAHFLVEKSVTNNETTTQIYQLDEKGKINEISRMLGGSKAATEHAISLLKQGT